MLLGLDEQRLRRYLPPDQAEEIIRMRELTSQIIAKHTGQSFDTVERDVDWVAGAFMLLPRAVFDATGGFSEAFFMYGEDMEWCYRLRRAGYPVRYVPSAKAIHHGNQSAGQLPPEWRIRRTHDAKYTF